MAAEFRMGSTDVEHLFITVQRREHTGAQGNVLSFRLADVDQTYLPGWISNLDDIEKSFPVIGRP